MMFRIGDRIVLKPSYLNNILLIDHVIYYWITEAIKEVGNNGPYIVTKESSETGYITILGSNYIIHGGAFGLEDWLDDLPLG